jgi:hypothetical protein
VLLSADRRCFATNNLRTNLSSLTVDDIINAATEFKPVSERLIYRIGGHSGRTKGLVTNPFVAFPFKSAADIAAAGSPAISEWSRFPACCARLYRRKFFWVVPVPFFNKSFSRPGDSGSWVINKNGSGKNHWLGMVQGGDGRDTIILHAPSLIEYFATLLKAKLESSIIEEM